MLVSVFSLFATCSGNSRQKLKSLGTNIVNDPDAIIDTVVVVVVMVVLSDGPEPMHARVINLD